MSLSGEENPAFARVIAVLRELGKESLLEVFKENELTVSGMHECKRLFETIKLSV